MDDNASSASTATDKSSVRAKMSFSFGPLDAQIFMRGTFIEKSIQMAIGSLLTYDTLITIDKEVKYFWTVHWYTMTHVLFFLNRYIGIFSAVSLIFCKFVKWTGDIGDILNVLVIDYILVIRVLALWSNNKLLSILLRVLIFCEAVVKLTLTAKVVMIDNVSVIAKNVTTCANRSATNAQIGKLGLIDWLFSLIIGLILLTLALYKSIRYHKLSGFKKTNLPYIIMRDQIIYYLIVIFCSTINLISYSTPPLSNSNGSYVLNILGNPSFLCLFGSRMFINLKEAGSLDVKGGPSISSKRRERSNLSDIMFAGQCAPSSNGQDPTTSQVTLGSIDNT